MLKYLCLFVKSFKVGLTYRSMAVSQLLFSALGLAIQFSLWYALMGGGAYQGVPFRDMVAYLLVSELVRGLVYVEIADVLEGQIRDGSVIANLIRPASFKGYLISDALGGNAYKLVVSTLPLLAITYFAFGFTLPPTAAHGAAFLVSVALGMLIMIEINYIVGLLAFVVQRTWYLDWYINAGLTLFGGAQIPLWFYPDWLNALSNCLPFRYIIFEPMNLYLGRTAIANAYQPILIACAWFAFLRALEAFAWRRIRLRLTVNGG